MNAPICTSGAFLKASMRWHWMKSKVQGALFFVCVCRALFKSVSMHALVSSCRSFCKTLNRRLRSIRLDFMPCNMAPCPGVPQFLRGQQQHSNFLSITIDSFPMNMNSLSKTSSSNKRKLYFLQQLQGSTTDQKMDTGCLQWCWHTRFHFGPCWCWGSCTI